MRYLLDAKRHISDTSTYNCDFFISAYNDSDRVKTVFNQVSCNFKRWWIIPEYGFQEAELESISQYNVFTDYRESDLIMSGMQEVIDSANKNSKICIDITGFMRNHILYFLKYLQMRGIKEFDALYTEPIHYFRKADTTFSEKVSEVRQVEGYEGSHQSDTSNDVLLLGIGYDNDPMARVKLSKEQARVVQLHSLPSLSADMYHESLLRLNKATNVSRAADDSLLFASANDPFVVAQILSKHWTDMNARRKVTNIYLCPLSTKVQALGFGIFYLTELQNERASIILPTVDAYSRKTSSGVGRTWIYPVHLD